MSRNKYIEHKGEITEITPESITARFLNKSMCASCHAKSVCGAGDSEIKFIQVPNDSGETYQVGEEVIIRMVPSMGYKAVWLSYVIPLIILMILLLYLPNLNLSELWVGLIALSSIGIYYFIIYLFRGKIADKFVFTIAKNYNYK